MENNMMENNTLSIDQLWSLFLNRSLQTH